MQEYTLPIVHGMTSFSEVLQRSRVCGLSAEWERALKTAHMMAFTLARRAGHDLGFNWPLKYYWAVCKGDTPKPIILIMKIYFQQHHL